MTTRAEKLAWELVRVLAKYRPKEIDEAISLMQGGQIFDRSSQLLDEISKSRQQENNNKMRSQAPLIDDHFSLGMGLPAPSKQSEPVQNLNEDSKVINSRTSGPQHAADVSDRTQKARENFVNLSDADKAVIRDLADGIASGSYLKTSSLLRDYASRLSIDLPKKLPSRSNLCLQIIEEILLVERSQVHHFIDAAKSMSGDVSSLQEWSNLIVRRN